VIRHTLLDLLDPAERARLRRSDRRPTLALYRVAHEGVSGGAVLGIGRMPKRWSRARVTELAEKMNGGVPVYRGHSDTSERIAIGNVIKCFTKIANSGVEAFALVHIAKPEAAKEAVMMKLDAASIEADLSLEPGGDAWDVAQVERVTGLALAEKSGGNAPGFSRAGLIAAVRESLDANDDPPAHADARDGNNHCDVGATISEALAGKNVTRGEWEFVYRRVMARIGDDRDKSRIILEVKLCLEDIEEAKRLYRRPPPQIAAPAERFRGPLDYRNPEHNELIPR